jgi:GlpG protein
VTPIFIHFGVTHLVFNMFALYVFGSQIEDRLGTWQLGLLVLVLAVPSNIAQNAVSGPAFGGMSGVVYGLFGYIWIRMMFDQSCGLFVSPINVLIMVGWFVLCIAGSVPILRPSLEHIVGDVANMAHTVGLFLGAALGYLPVLLRTRPK